jgi:hypothetical protein
MDAHQQLLIHQSFKLNIHSGYPGEEQGVKIPPPTALKVTLSSHDNPAKGIDH